MWRRSGGKTTIDPTRCDLLVKVLHAPEIPVDGCMEMSFGRFSTRRCRVVQRKEQCEGRDIGERSIDNKQMGPECVEKQ
jgi:hypothetical protein